MLDGMVSMKKNSEYLTLISILKSFPLRKNVNLENEKTKISSAIDLFSSILFERFIARLLDKYPNVNFEVLDSQSTIEDVFNLINISCNNEEEISFNNKDLKSASLEYISNLGVNNLIDRSPKISSIGIDLESKNSISEDIFLIKNTDFRKRLFNESEILYSITKTDPVITLTGIFAAKEAIIKSLSSSKKIQFKEITICHDDHGKPYALLNKKNLNALLSISHTGEYAISICLL